MKRLRLMSCIGGASEMKEYRIFLIFLFLHALSPVSMAQNDCERAKEVYAQGVQSIQYTDRRDAFARAIQLCPDYAEAYVNLADAYEHLGEFDQAERTYEKAAQLSSRMIAPYIGLGEIYLKTGRFPLALIVVEEGLKLSPDNERLLEDKKVISERCDREKRPFTNEEIMSCLRDDEAFKQMCMCPTDYSSFLRKWICLPTIWFSAGSADLGPAGRKQLDQVGKAFAAMDLSGKTISIVGYADTLGTKERNLKLSESRAKSVKHYLVTRFRIDPGVFTIQYYGQDSPRSPNTTQQNRADNRRVVILPGW
ncbi:MAG: OmpA family protein [Thermodesulfobacteriota bacterium]